MWLAHHKIYNDENRTPSPRRLSTFRLKTAAKPRLVFHRSWNSTYICIYISVELHASASTYFPSPLPRHLLSHIENFDSLYNCAKKGGRDGEEWRSIRTSIVHWPVNFETMLLPSVASSTSCVYTNGNTTRDVLANALCVKTSRTIFVVHFLFSNAYKDSNYKRLPVRFVIPAMRITR